MAKMIFARALLAPMLLPGVSGVTIVGVRPIDADYVELELEGGGLPVGAAIVRAVVNERPATIQGVVRSTTLEAVG